MHLNNVFDIDLLNLTITQVVQTYEWYVASCPNHNQREKNIPFDV